MCTNIKPEQYFAPKGKVVDFNIPCFECEECHTGNASIENQLLVHAECLQERVVFQPVNQDNPIVLIWEPDAV